LTTGPTLQEVLDEKERYYLNALECMRQLLKILEYLESCGVIHDDVKGMTLCLYQKHMYRHIF